MEFPPLKTWSRSVTRGRSLPSKTRMHDWGRLPGPNRLGSQLSIPRTAIHLEEDEEEVRGVEGEEGQWERMRQMGIAIRILSVFIFAC